MSSDDDGGQGFVTQWQRIPVPKNPQRARKRQRYLETLQTRRERINQFLKDSEPEQAQYLTELLKRAPSIRNASLVQSPRIFISEQDAFDMLCCECLRQERFPQDILNAGKATGWYERMKMLGDKYGWSIEISIRDKGGK